jgi:hypothetical protein
MNTPRTARPIPPLLRRTQLLPGESLPSLLERLAQLNYYPSLHILRDICYEQPDVMGANQDNLACPHWVEGFLRLTELTRIAPEDLYTASNHRFAPFLNPPGQTPLEIPWSGSTSKIVLTDNLAYGCLRSTTTAQYCPHCLKDTAYHRLNWVPLPAAICLEHHCLLVNQCPRCRKQLSIGEITKNRCKACQANLYMAESLSVEEDELGILSQQVIQSWFSAVDVSELSLQYNLPSCPPAVLYRFLQNLSRRLLNRQEDWDVLSAPLDKLHGLIASSIQKRQSLQSLTPEAIFHLYRTAFTAVMDWPTGLFQFLDAYSGCSSTCQTPTDRNRHLSTIRNNWFQRDWKNPDLKFVQQSFIDYLLIRNIPLPVSLVEKSREVAWFVEQTGLCSVEHVAPTLEISTQGLHQLLQRGLLNSCLWAYSRPNTPIFEYNKLLSLKQQWKLGWSVKQASSWLGISERDVIELVDWEVLDIVDRPDPDADTWLLSRQSVEKFFDKVASQLSLFEGNKKDILWIAEVVGCLDYLGIRRAALLQSVADGFLPGLRLEVEIHSLNRVHFLRASILEFPDLFYARRGKVAGNVFAREKGLSISIVRSWIEAGLIKPEMKFGVDDYFLRSRLEQLAAEYVTDVGQSHYL